MSDRVTHVAKRHRRLITRGRMGMGAAAGGRATGHTKVSFGPPVERIPPSSIQTPGAAHPNGSDPSQRPIAQRVGPVWPLAAGEVDQFAFHFQPNVSDEMAIDYLSRIAPPAERHRVADRGRSGAIEHPTHIELRLPAEQSQREVADPAPSRPSPPIEPVDLIDRITRAMSALISSGTAGREPTIISPWSCRRMLLTALAIDHRRPAGRSRDRPKHNPSVRRKRCAYRSDRSARARWIAHGRVDRSYKGTKSVPVARSMMCGRMKRASTSGPAVRTVGDAPDRR